MSEELKPCPFCGSKEVYRGTFALGPNMPWNFNIKCMDCFAEGPICDTEQEAISAWNRRK